jgi:hypothetical protein
LKRRQLVHTGDQVQGQSARAKGLRRPSLEGKRNVQKDDRFDIVAAHRINGKLNAGIAQHDTKNRFHVRRAELDSQLVIRKSSGSRRVFRAFAASQGAYRRCIAFQVVNARRTIDKGKVLSFGRYCVSQVGVLNHDGRLLRRCRRGANCKYAKDNAQRFHRRSPNTDLLAL